jgi:hypothetical protein
MKKQVLILMITLCSLRMNSQTGVTCSIDGAVPVAMDAYTTNLSGSLNQTVVITSSLSSVISINIDGYVSNGITNNIGILGQPVNYKYNGVTYPLGTITSSVGNTYTFTELPTSPSLDNVYYIFWTNNAFPYFIIMQFKIYQNANIFALNTSTPATNQVNFNWTPVSGGHKYEYVLNSSASIPATLGTTTTSTYKTFIITPADTVGLRYFHVRAMDTTITSWETYPLHLSYSPTILGIKEIETISKLSLFPNPAKEDLTVEFNSASGLEPIKIYTIAGLLVLENNEIRAQGMNRIKIDLNLLAGGLYFVEIGNYRQKVVKQ